VTRTDRSDEVVADLDALRYAEELFVGVFGDGAVPLAELRTNLDAMMDRAVGDDVQTQSAVIAGVDALLVRAGRVAPDAIMVWLHGGGYVMGSAHGYRHAAAMLSRATELAVVVPNYRLAPEFPFPAALDDASAVVDELVESHGGSRVVVGGDSAGGGLVMASLQRARDRGTELPAAAVVVSPLADFSASGASITSNSESDRVISARSLKGLAASYLRRHDRKDPLASPVYGDLSGLPPVLMMASDSEVLLDDAVRMHDSVQLAGGTSTLSVYPDTCHAWTLFADFMPQAKSGVDEIARFVRGVLQ
jgi:epsilon-lactone hydrolase